MSVSWWQTLQHDPACYLALSGSSSCSSSMPSEMRQVEPTHGIHTLGVCVLVRRQVMSSSRCRGRERWGRGKQAICSNVECIIKKNIFMVQIHSTRGPESLCGIVTCFAPNLKGYWVRFPSVRSQDALTPSPSLLFLM